MHAGSGTSATPELDPAALGSPTPHHASNPPVTVHPASSPPATPHLGSASSGHPPAFTAEDYLAKAPKKKGCKTSPAAKDFQVSPIPLCL
jgi:hypothetical protein